jgi:hypothetical protein
MLPSYRKSFLHSILEDKDAKERGIVKTHPVSSSVSSEKIGEAEANALNCNSPMPSI